MRSSRTRAGSKRRSAWSTTAFASGGAYNSWAVDGEVEDVTAPEDPPAVDGADGSAATYGPEEVGGDDEKAARSRTVVVHVDRPEHEERASTVVRRRDIEERLPRSAPDALRYEPGVYVQQTAHSQGSPYVRGVTGQQTIMMFDGIRLNNSTFRQGPNQYFFTIDSRTVQRLEVVRGAASTRYGSDAMGGALLAAPIQPSLALGDRRWVVRPRAGIQGATADGELGGRAQLEVGYRGKLGFVGGVGYRDVGQLRTGGPIRSPATGKPALTPRFADDGVTQLGTGFRELTADGRLVWQASERTRLTLGAAYRDGTGAKGRLQRHTYLQRTGLLCGLCRSCALYENTGIHGKLREKSNGCLLENRTHSLC